MECGAECQPQGRVERSKITGEKSFGNDHVLGMLKCLQDYFHHALVPAIWIIMGTVSCHGGVPPGCQVLTPGS